MSDRRFAATLALIVLVTAARIATTYRVFSQTADEPYHLAARYDYEHWLEREIARKPAFFQAPEVSELLPADLLAQIPTATQAAPRVVATPAPALPPKPAADLTIKMLGPVEIFRDPARSFAADAWTTKRARDILCFIASRRHRRASFIAVADAATRATMILSSRRLGLGTPVPCPEYNLDRDRCRLYGPGAARSGGRLGPGRLARGLDPRT